MEPLQVNRQRVLPSYIVHPQEVVYSLKWLQLRQKVRCNAKVLPADFPIEILWMLRVKLLQLFNHFFVLDHELGRNLDELKQVVGGVGLPCRVWLLVGRTGYRALKSLQSPVGGWRPSVNLATPLHRIGPLNCWQLRGYTSFGFLAGCPSGIGVSLGRPRVLLLIFFLRSIFCILVVRL